MKPDKPKYIASKETAKNEIQKLLDYYEIDIKEIEKREIRKAIENGYDRLVKAVRMGRLEVKIEGGLKVIQRTRPDKDEKSEIIEYREIDGTAKCEMDGYPPDAHYSKAYALMGSLSNMGEGYIKKLKSVDLSALGS